MEACFLFFTLKNNCGIFNHMSATSKEKYINTERPRGFHSDKYPPLTYFNIWFFVKLTPAYKLSK